MSDPFAPRVGGVLSADIAVPEHEREVRFYSRVLSTGESPLWREDLMNNLGMPIIGLGARSTEHEMLPLQWMPHIQVADVATSVERALGLGGSELMHPTFRTSRIGILRVSGRPICQSDAARVTGRGARRTGPAFIGSIGASRQGIEAVGRLE